jgi:hypothetical protein
MEQAVTRSTNSQQLADASQTVVAAVARPRTLPASGIRRDGPLPRAVSRPITPTTSAIAPMASGTQRPAAGIGRQPPPDRSRAAPQRPYPEDEDPPGLGCRSAGHGPHGAYDALPVEGRRMLARMPRPRAGSRLALRRLTDRRSTRSYARSRTSPKLTSGPADGDASTRSSVGERSGAAEAQGHRLAIRGLGRR